MKKVQGKFTKRNHWEKLSLPGCNCMKPVKIECDLMKVNLKPVCKFIRLPYNFLLTLKVLVATTDAQWEGMGDVGSARYEPALLPPCPTIRVLSYSN